MVPRHPEDLFEVGGGAGKGRGEVVVGFADVAGEDEGVVRVRRQGGPGGEVGGVAEVEVGEGVEFGHGGWGGAAVGCAQQGNSAMERTAAVTWFELGGGVTWCVMWSVRWWGGGRSSC